MPLDRISALPSELNNPCRGFNPPDTIRIHPDLCCEFLFCIASRGPLSGVFGTVLCVRGRGFSEPFNGNVKPTGPKPFQLPALPGSHSHPLFGKDMQVAIRVRPCRHPSAPRPAATNLAHDICLGEPHGAQDQRRAPDDVPRHDIVTPSDDEGDERQCQEKPTADVARPHDHSSLENDSHFHQPTTPADLEPQAYQSPLSNPPKYADDFWHTQGRAPRRSTESANKRPPRQGTPVAPQGDKSSPYRFSPRVHHG